jgi:ATP-dependent Lon protease
VSYQTIVQHEYLPVLPLRDSVIMPFVRMPLLVGRESSILAVEQAIQSSGRILLVTQKDAKVDSPKVKDLYPVAVLADVLQNSTLPDGTLNILVEGYAIVRLAEVNDSIEEGVMVGSFEVMVVTTCKTKEVFALKRYLLQQFNDYLQLMGRVFEDVSSDMLTDNEDPEWTINFLICFVELAIKTKQALLEMTDLFKRMQFFSGKLQEEIDILRMQNKIMGEVREQMDQSQKEYILHEQMKAISRELGEKTDAPVDEGQELQTCLDKSKMPKDSKAQVQSEIKKLSQMAPYSPEASVIRNYVELVLDLPWSQKSGNRLDVAEASKILDKDHYGLEEPKERILEYLAVCQLTSKAKGTVLCLVGPPGVGKTSLVKSLATAMDREFVRISLGGVRDEAEIRGHRRTYIGSMPGKIIQALKKVKVKNPVILLDEVDKMSMDSQGDPAAALLEVLDPEQNENFEDHYVDLGFDLSDIVFVATANAEEMIPYALHDRLEIICLEGYTELEKLQIASRFLVGKQREANGVPQVKINNKTLQIIIRDYTREAGVRQIDRCIAKMMRKVARRVVEGQETAKSITLRPKDVSTYLGVPPFGNDLKLKKPKAGVVTGLAWTSVGGDTMPIEVTKMPGKEKLTLTGQLGDVMQESAQAALSYLRTHAKALCLESNFYEKYELHLHVPEGAIPKDGPSAGITMVSALYSVLSGKPVSSEIAMTGEVTLTGQVLRIGGLKSKTLAALRMGIKTVILPEDNRKDLEKLPDEVKDQIEFIFVKDVKQVLNFCHSVKRTK